MPYTFFTMLLLSIGLACTQTACTPDQVTGTLDALLAAADTAASVIAPQDIPTLNLVTACADGAITELSSSDSNVQKATITSADCVDAVAAVAKAGSTLSVVANALQVFLNQVTTLETSAAVKASVNHTHIKVNAKKIRQLRSKLNDIKAKIAARSK